MTNPNLKWSFPLPRPHTGIPLGNGLLGALVWGSDRLCITLNRADFWDHRGAFEPTPGVSTYEHIRSAYYPESDDWFPAVFPVAPRTAASPRPSRLPFGRFELELRSGCTPLSGELDLPTGRVTLRFIERGRRIRPTVTFDLCVRDPILWIHDPAGLIQKVSIRTAWEWVGDRLRELTFPEPVTIKKSGTIAWAQACPADPALAALCRKTAEGFLIALDRGEDAHEALAAAGRLARTATRRGLEKVQRDNAIWWGAYWERAPHVTLPDSLMNRLYTYGLYKLGAATNPLCPWPAGLQGPWVEEYQWPPWAADYHFNVNVQQVYTLPLAANQTEHLLPLFNWIDTNRKIFREVAKIVCGIEDGLIIGMCCDDRGALLGLGPGVLIDHACTGWIAQLYWQYYQYTGDLVFLRERAFPFLRSTLRVYEAMLEEHDGRLSLGVGISAEFGNDIYPRFMGRDPSWQLACIHMLVEALSEAACLLSVPPDPSWAILRERVPPYTLVGPPGEERIGIWEGQDLAFSHRHHSHLASLYPFDSLGEPTPEVKRILEDSIDHWIEMGMGGWSEWCMPWAAILQARMGFRESPWMLLRIWREVFINEGLAAVYLPRFRGLTAHRKEDQKIPRKTNEIMQLDGTMAALSALYEMLVQTRNGVTHLFPAIPEAWADLAFAGLRLPGAFLIDADRKGSTLRSVRIRSLNGGSLTLAVDGYTALRLRQGNKTKTVTLPATLSFCPGESVRLSPVLG